MNTPLLTRQAGLRRLWPQAHELFTRRGLATHTLDALSPLIERFEIRVPLIGAFSSGKSRLLNALIGENLLAVEVTPETAVPTELRWGTQRQFIGRRADGSTLALTERHLQDNELGGLYPGGWVEVELPNATLGRYPDLVLVDLPGWDSGLTAHETAIDHYASHSLAYVLVISAEEGTLRDTQSRALRELADVQMPVVLLLSKCDKRPEDVVRTVSDRLVQDFTHHMGRPPLALVHTSGHKKRVAEFEAALDLLQARSGERFETCVVAPIRQELQNATRHLTLLARHDPPDAAQLQAQIEALQQQAADFDIRLTQETTALDEQVGPILGTIRLRVENALSSRADWLTDRAMVGQDISDDILGTARGVVTEALRQEFEPAVQRYLARLADALPSRLDFELNLQRPDSATPSGEGEFRWKALATFLGPLLLKVPHPIAKILAPVVMLLGSLLDNRADAQRRELELARQREQVRRDIYQALQRAVSQIDDQLRPVLHAQVQKAKAEVARAIETERKELLGTLTKLQTEVARGEAAAAELRQGAQADLERLTTWLAALAPVEQPTPQPAPVR